MLDGKPGGIKIPVTRFPHFQPPFLSAMNFRLCSGLAAIVCMALASCYPYNENQHKKKTKGPEKTLTPEQQKKLTDEEARKKAEEELKKKEQQQNAEVTPPQNNGGTTTPPPEGPKPPTEKRTYVVAQKVPGKEGFVFSPYNNKVIDVHNPDGSLIPSGTLVADPTYPESEKKYFRVP